jgi:ADP-ribose pyrophosphatase YjhB (NUDIX family)
VAVAIVNDDGKLLAIRRRDNGHWEPPGGVLELDETIEDGLVREVRAETGLTVMPERLTRAYKNMERGIVALVFRCSVVAGAQTSTAEPPRPLGLQLTRSETGGTRRTPSDCSTGCSSVRRGSEFMTEFGY